MGLFSKISKGVNSTFKKVDNGFKTFTKGANDIADKVGKGIGQAQGQIDGGFKTFTKGANNVVDKVNKGIGQAQGQVDLGLRRASNTARAVGGDIAKYSSLAQPFLTAVNPDLGILAGSLAQGGKSLKQAGNMIHDARGNVRDLSGQAQSSLMKAKMDPNALNDVFA